MQTSYHDYGLQKHAKSGYHCAMKNFLMAFQHIGFGLMCGLGNLFLFLAIHNTWDPGRAIIVGTVAMIVMALVDRHQMMKRRPDRKPHGGASTPSKEDEAL